MLAAHKGAGAAAAGRSGPFRGVVNRPCSSIKPGDRPVRRLDVTARAEGTTSAPWHTRPCGPNSVEVSSVQELVDVLATDQLVIVDVFAPWCGACRALFPKVSKLLADYPDVKLVKVNFEENKAMCKSLGIKVLPYFIFYHGAAGRVAAFSATVSKLERFKEALELHSGAICSLEPPAVAEFPGVNPEHPADATLLGRDGWDAGRVAEAAAAS